VTPLADKQRARVSLGDAQAEVELGRLTDWIKLTFHAAPLVNVTCLTRLQLLECGEHVSLYLTPLNFDPKPAMRSRTLVLRTYWPRRSPVCHAGPAEDTWASTRA